MKHFLVSGFGKDAKIVRELTTDEIKMMNGLKWLKPKEVLMVKKKPTKPKYR